MMSKKITTTLFLPLLFVASQSAYATYSYSRCPAGTTEELVGTGIISGGSFSPGPGSPVYACIPGGRHTTAILSETTTNTLQIERTTNSTINQHLMNKVVREYVATDAKVNKGSASADSSSYKPDTFWGETNVSSLTEHHNKTPGFATNIYQFNAGLDKRQGDLFYGAALTYAYTDNNLPANTDNVMHTVGITPYMAYKINDFLFASGLGSY